jgi:fucose permease
VVLGLVSAILILGLVFCPNRRLAMVLIPTVGLAFGPIFPTLMAVLLGAFPQAVHGRAVGFFFAVGGVGWTVVPMLIGIYAQRTSVQRGLIIAVGLALGLCGVALLILLR